jgi:hypothetical protein
MAAEQNHAEYAAAWWGRAASGRTPGEQLDLFARALAALWERSRPTLSDVTLTAIFDRALHTTRDAAPLLGRLTLSGDGVGCEGLRADTAASADELAAAARLLLSELLGLLGALTAELLTARLRAALAAIAHDDAAPQARRPTLKIAAPAEEAGEDKEP